MRREVRSYGRHASCVFPRRNRYMNIHNCQLSSWRPKKAQAAHPLGRLHPAWASAARMCISPYVSRAPPPVRAQGATSTCIHTAASRSWPIGAPSFRASPYLRQCFSGRASSFFVARESEAARATPRTYRAVLSSRDGGSSPHDDCELLRYYHARTHDLACTRRRTWIETKDECFSSSLSHVCVSLAVPLLVFSLVLCHPQKTTPQS